MPRRPELVDRLRELDFPANLTADDLRRAAHDAQYLHRQLSQRPEEIRELLGAVLEGRTDGAAEKVRALGLGEEDFQNADGGIIAIIIIIILLYATDAY